MAHGDTALENEPDEDIPITTKDRSRDPPVWKENGGSGDLMVADHEDVQETEASDIHVNRFKKPRSTRRGALRSSVCERNFKS